MNLPSPSGEGSGAGHVRPGAPDNPHPNPSPKGEGLDPGRPVTPDFPVVLAAIAGAHGVAGEVRLKLFGEGRAALKRHKAFNGGKLTLEKLRDDGKGGAIARFAGIADRNAAETLRGTELTVSRAALPPIAADEYYHADLVGLPCVFATGEDLGTCVGVENFGAGDVLEIEKSDGKRFMVPMREEAVPEWNSARIVIAPGWED